jgi:F-type H+-transporting ATPase subunit b
VKFTLKSLASPFALPILALVLAAGSAASPVRVLAQEPAAAAQTAAPSTQPAAAKAKSEDVNENQFRHTDLVAAIGKKLGLDVETSARLFEWINFGIIVFAIVIPLVKFLPKALRKRRETLSQNLAEARKTTTDANSRLSAVEAQLAKLDEEITKIRAQVEDEIKNDEARIKSSLGEESARIVAAAEQEIGVAAAQAQRGLKAFAADLAIDHAVKQLTLTAENDRALIEEFVAQTEPGGKN